MDSMINPLLENTVRWLASVFDYRLDEPRLRAFSVALEDIPGDALKEAAKTWIKFGRRMPRPSELRITAQTGDVPGTTVPPIEL
ncbi:TPA: hypothetical protein ACK3PA_002734 [Burkholderia cenocepacia]